MNYHAGRKEEAMTNYKQRLVTWCKVIAKRMALGVLLLGIAAGGWAVFSLLSAMLLIFSEPAVPMLGQITPSLKQFLTPWLIVALCGWLSGVCYCSLKSR